MRQRISVKAFAAACAVAGLAGLAGGAGGCASMAVAEGNIGQRVVAASTESTTVRVHGHDESVDLDVAGRTVHVTASQITWPPDGVLALPEQWNRLELREFRGKTYVRLDGKQIGIIPPSK